MSENDAGTFSKSMDIFMKTVALAFALIVLGYIAGFLPPGLWYFECIALICVFILGFGPNITTDILKRKYASLTWNLVAMLLGISSCVYLFFEIPRLEATYGSVWVTADIVFGTFLIISILELCRQKFGLALPITALAFLMYVLYGNLLPRELLGHTGFSYSRTISFIFGPAGIFGEVMSTFVRIIFLYMLFGAFLISTGVGTYLVDLAYGCAGRWRGGPAKVAIIASAVLGMVNGNSVANVATIGSMTIPLMKKVGYKPTFAAAVESVASTGGQILPPVMGAGAFLMAEFLQMRYIDVAAAAFLPAVLYFVGVYFMVDLEAVKEGLKGIDETPDTRRLLKSSFLLLPIFVLLFELAVIQESVTRAGIITILSCIVISWFTKENKMNFRKIIDALITGAKSSIGIASSCSVAGIIIASTGITGLGNRFGSVVLAYAGDNVLIVGLFVALIAVIVGLGLPTTASYIITMAIAVPTLVKIGVTPLSAHLFVFYYAILSAITPPVGAAYYTAAAIADAPPQTTGNTAFLLGLGAYIVPFFFISSDLLLMKGAPLSIIIALVTAVIGVATLSMALQGVDYTGKVKFKVFQRILLGVAFLLMVDPNLNTDLMGFCLIFVTFLLSPSIWRSFFGKKETVVDPNQDN